MHDLDGTGCPQVATCANAGRKCGLCHDLNCYAPGRSTGKGRHHERVLTKRVNTRAHLRAGSGSAAHAKGDVIDPAFLFEGKSGYAQLNARGSKSCTLHRSWLTKIETEALAEGRFPALALHFDGTPDDEIWVVLRLELLQELRQ